MQMLLDKKIVHEVSTLRKIKRVVFVGFSEEALAAHPFKSLTQASTITYGACKPTDKRDKCKDTCGPNTELDSHTHTQTNKQTETLLHTHPG